METIRFSSGCKLLDLVTGGAKGVYGFPAGKFINIVGDKSAGKTFLANEIIASAYHKYGDKKFKWVYDDCESGYSFDSVGMYGFDIIGENPVHSETVEDAFCNISNFAKKLKSDQFGIYVIDSLDGLTSAEQDERAEERIKAYDNGKEYTKGSYNMGKQKYLSQEFCPQLCSVIQDKNILVIIISQIRENVDMFSFEKFSRSGGKAIDFYAHSVIWLATVKKIEKKDRVVGVVVKAKTTKSKTPRPFRECFFSLIYDYGLDNTGTSVDYLFDLRTEKGELTKKANVIKWDNGDSTGLSELKKWLSETTYKDYSLADMYEDSKYFDGKATADSIIEFTQSKSDLKKLYAERFGESMTREELIQYIEDNSLQEELEKRVEEKWESVEDSIRTTRRKKYATQPAE
jgi:RecA/RadA recombinase